MGMTAHYLTHSTYPIKKGDTALVHAAAGGAGLLIVQMAKRLGARVNRDRFDRRQGGAGAGSRRGHNSFSIPARISKWK
jgi:hypothetical protein